MKVTKKRERPAETLVCPIAAAMAVLGDKWIVLILRDLLIGLRRFDEFLTSLGISTNILADRLKKLQDDGLVEKRAYQSNPTRYEYAPTPQAEDVLPAIVALANWSMNWRLEPEEASQMRWTNAKTGNPIQISVEDSVTREPVTFADLTFAPMESPDDMSRWRVDTGIAHRTAAE